LRGAQQIVPDIAQMRTHGGHRLRRVAPLDRRYDTIVIDEILLDMEG
jgi:hypothetical protein